MTDNTHDDETTDENESADGPTTITVPVTVALDDVHEPAFADLCATTPDRETALQQIGDRIAVEVECETFVYQAYRANKRHQQQAAAQMQRMLGGDGEDNGDE